MYGENENNSELILKPLPKDVSVKGGQDVKSLIPQSTDEFWLLAQMFYKAGLAPKCKNDYETFGLMGFGAELGFTPIQSLRTCAMINGTPGVYGAGLMAKVIEAGHKVEESFEGEEFEDDFKAICIITRADNGQVIERSFSVKQAKRADLWITEEKIDQDAKWMKSVWYKYPDRMLRHRARGQAIDDGLADIFFGVPTVEELLDRDPIDVTPPPSQGAKRLKEQIQNMEPNRTLGDDEDIDDVMVIEDDEIIDAEIVDAGAVNLEIENSDDENLITLPAEAIEPHESDKEDPADEPEGSQDAPGKPSKPKAAKPSKSKKKKPASKDAEPDVVLTPNMKDWFDFVDGCNDAERLETVFKEEEALGEFKGLDDAQLDHVRTYTQKRIDELKSK